ncbi:phosphatidylethanolamine/phosphatidyl-N-methylethanolamine N-methyltransferase [Cohaesibacter sp. ES.047]|uniref:class I SAM-dependent methyltransferase n=1 Tax=Cohaesibacter sp. ES.047 TaxID=1798205 RepID=UPI000BB80460|nr:rRNA adenine N-6-methyltransferase family protein [Cohaesibacter sp. ES.047]SNY90482.1 phosphatidylethanolamine/phosphatidyl-N-methylethanolamine N-methyltransferase [Cohaesibacter sp. ES.047]
MLKQLRNHPVIDRLPDEIRFLRQWFENPLKVGAVAPSSPALARKMASYINVDDTGPVVELGPGTGVVTQAVLDHGVDPSRILAVEYSDEFVDILKDRFAGATVIQGDAYDFEAIRQAHIHQPLSAVVSSLPLFNQPKPMRRRLIELCLDALSPGAPFIQFSYALVPPVPQGDGAFCIESSNWIIGNLPPARVWVYRRPAA